MFKKVLAWIGIGLAGAGILASASAQSQSSIQPPEAQSRAILNRYCVPCHNERLRTAGLTLDKMSIGNPGEGAEAWEKVVGKLRAGQMPPAGMPRPDKPVYDSLAAYLETELDRSAAARPNPGRPGIRRLNRAEYTNAT